MRRASLIAAVGILLVGFGALAFVRPWGLRLPRWLIIVPALAVRALVLGTRRLRRRIGVALQRTHGLARLRGARRL